MERLPKGHKVIYAMPADNLHRERLVENKVSFTEDDTKIFIECMVSGDTKENGLSVIAIDNPEFCVARAYDSFVGRHIREEVISGYMKSPSMGGKGCGYGLLTCPY